MFTEKTEVELRANLAAEAGMPLLVTLRPEVYRELVYAARQWDAMRAGIRILTAAAPFPGFEPRQTLVGCGDGNTFAVG